MQKISSKKHKTYIKVKPQTVTFFQNMVKSTVYSYTRSTGNQYEEEKKCWKN